MAKKCLKVQKGVKKEGFHNIGATIRTRRESRCLPYAGLTFLYVQSFLLDISSCEPNPNCHVSRLPQWYGHLSPVPPLVDPNYPGSPDCLQLPGQP